MWWTRVNFTAEELDREVATDDLVTAVSAAGYSAHPVIDDSDGDAEQEGRHRLYRSLLHNFWFAAIVSLPVIYFSYPEIFPGVPEKGSTELNLIWGGMALASLAVTVYSGSQFFTGARAAFKHRSANMYTLIAIGISAAWLYSTVALLFPGFFPRNDSGSPRW